MVEMVVGKGIRIGIDKLQVRMGYSGVKDPGFMQLQAWVKNVKDAVFSDINPFCTTYHPVKAGKIWKPKACSSLTNVSQPLGGNATLHVLYGYNHDAFQAWFRFNPAKPCMAVLAGHLNFMLDHGFASLVHQGIVTRCEIAIDIDGAAFGDYVYLDTNLRTERNAYSSVGTMYVGSELGSRSFRIYDKRKELLKKSGEHLPHDRLRVEAVLRGPQRCFPMYAIKKIPNPFGTLLIVDRNKFLSLTSPALTLLQEAAQSKNPLLQTAYAKLPKSARATAQKVLAPLQPDWWRPDKIWLSYPMNFEWMKTALVSDGYGQMWQSCS